MTSPASAGRLWAVVGATGTGKTALSLDLAEALAGRGRSAEIVNADAMQVYRGMDIGTAKVPVSERRGVPHHLLDVLDPSEEATVAWYQGAARTSVADVHARGNDAILVGGSGLYVSSVLYDFRFPPRDESLRSELEAELARSGPGPLFLRLRERDPQTAARIDPRNGRRVVRALEVLAQGEATHGAALPDAPLLWNHDTIVIGARVERAQLVARLDERVRRMWDTGIVDEVRALESAGVTWGTTAARAIGYAQAIAQREGRLSESEAIAQTQALTRRYARRQVAWFRRDRRIHWIDTDAAPDVEEILAGAERSAAATTRADRDP